MVRAFLAKEEEEDNEDEDDDSSFFSSSSSSSFDIVRNVNVVGLRSGDDRDGSSGRRAACEGHRMRTQKSP